jgi:hypothetical protein
LVHAEKVQWADGPSSWWAPRRRVLEMDRTHPLQSVGPSLSHSHHAHVKSSAAPRNASEKKGRRNCFSLNWKRLRVQTTAAPPHAPPRSPHLSCAPRSEGGEHASRPQPLRRGRRRRRPLLRESKNSRPLRRNLAAYLENAW